MIMQRWRMRFAVCGVLALLLMRGGHAHSCTSFRIESEDGAVLIGRSMEFGMQLNSTAMVVPRGFRLVSPAPDGGDGVTWHGKYGFVAMNGKGVDVATDGLNEAGLSVHLLLLPGFAKYQAAGAQDGSRALAHIAVGNWILSNFATVEEVKKAIEHVVVFRYELPGIGFVPVHYAIHDSKSALVIEYVEGQRHVYDNPVGVLTNSPPFDWQLTNLRNYLNLTNLNLDSLKLGSYTLQPIGQGTGLLSIPGDYTPPHRFVRATALTYAAVRPSTAAEGTNLAFHILNNVDIPLGAVADRASTPAAAISGNPPGRNSGLDYDVTQWATVSDLTNKIYYFRTYKNLAARKIELKKLSLSGKTIQHIAVDTVEQFMDAANQAK